MAESRRKQLQHLLEDLLGGDTDPTKKLNVYFQPSDDAQMHYPCIVYARDITSRKSADNITYSWRQRYQVTYIDYNPDSDVIDALMEFPYSRSDRHFATSGLNHDVFVIYH
jgi:hypothetical protein